MNLPPSMKHPVRGASCLSARFLVILLPCFVLSVVPLQAAAADSPESEEGTSADSLTGQETEARREQYINHYCGGCHPVPSPEVLPRAVWPAVVREMAIMAEERMGEPFITDEVASNVAEYYVGNAPESLPRLPLIPDTDQSLSFHDQAFGRRSPVPLIVNIHEVDLGIHDGKEFLVCDGENNTVSLLYRDGINWHERVLLNAPVPAHTEVVDFDGDGDRDIIVAALGVFPPLPAATGKIILLRRESREVFTAEILLEDVGRITDARPVDFDNDGDYDIAVAIFGGGDVGEVAWLENLGEDNFEQHTLLKAPGALNVSPVDLNQDGKMDIVTLMAQEHEAVVGFVNQGQGQFETVLLARFMHPVSGSTSLRVVDLDGDGDDDILFTNGDAHDIDSEPKPYHGVQWLENKGDLEFQPRDVGRLYGAATAAAGDMDGDGDLDIVASSWDNFWDEPGRQTMVWFENDGNQEFTPRRLLDQRPGIVTFELTDMTGDGRLDIIAGQFHYESLAAQINALVRDVPDPTRNIQDESDRFLRIITQEADDDGPGQ